MLCLVVKYWLIIVQVDEEELMRVLSMASNIKFGSCARKLSKYLNKLGLGCVRQVPKDNSVSMICTKLKNIAVIQNGRICLQI